MLPTPPSEEIKTRAIHMNRDPAKLKLEEFGSLPVRRRLHGRATNEVTDPLEVWKAEKRYPALIQWQDEFERITRGLNTELLLTFHPKGKVDHLDQSFDWFKRKNWLEPPVKEEKPYKGFLRLTPEEKLKTSGSLSSLTEPAMTNASRKLAHSMSLHELAPVSGVKPEEHGLPSEGLVQRLKQSVSLPQL
jgi:hypothetical protein